MTLSEIKTELQLLRETFVMLKRKASYGIRTEDHIGDELRYEKRRLDLAEKCLVWVCEVTENPVPERADLTAHFESMQIEVQNGK